MRSFVVTFLLGFLALIAITITAIRVIDGNLVRIFGAPITKIGDPLYHFDPNEIQAIYLRGNGIQATCVNTPYGWQIEEPWNDRMDPRAAQAIFEFTLNSEVVGAIPSEKIESDHRNFEDGRIRFYFKDITGDGDAKFIVGQKTAWRYTDPSTGEMHPTVFVEPRDRSRKDYIYATTDRQNIHSLLSDGFKNLRDHHPFLFHPNMIESIRLKNRNGELLMSRDHPKNLWKITKPMELLSNRENVIKLVQGLYDLKAVNVHDRSTITLPNPDSKKMRSIGLKYFNHPEEITLHIYPPESDDAKIALATVSDRPNAIFELPLLSTTNGDSEDQEPTHLGLNALPDSVNALRDPTLTNLDITAVREILISPANHDPIHLTRENPRRDFTYLLDDQHTKANELALYQLLQTVTKTPVNAFVSDTASDLSQYGLDEPTLTLTFIGFDQNVLKISFGQTDEQTTYAIRHGSTTVVEMNPSMIPVFPWEWRKLQVWHIAKPDIIGIKRQIRDQPTLDLHYDYLSTGDQWRIRNAANPDDALLIKERADKLLDHLLNFHAKHWLQPGHSDATRALANPDLSFSLLVKSHDKRGEFDQFVRYDLEIARISRGDHHIYYGRCNHIDYPFILNANLIPLLEVDLFMEP